MQDEAQMLAQAQLTIAEQQYEIARLRRGRANDRIAEDVRAALNLAAATSAIIAPVTHSRLLEMIVETAARIIDAQAVSLFLLDDTKQELVFEVALGQKAAEVKNLRVPVGSGLAGLVAASGQPMAISDAQHDPRHASDIARRVGYAPQSILCVPLFHLDEVIGVFELLDKSSAPSFTPMDMELLGLFANQAAVAIEQSRGQRNLTALVANALALLAGTPESQTQVFTQRANSVAAGIQDDPDFRKALRLAELVQDIVRQGEHESQACEAILRGFAEYLHSQPRSGGAA
ncbi:MAG: GAF domain-containing protein [Chloroflexota bacterium]